MAHRAALLPQEYKHTMKLRCVKKAEILRPVIYIEYTSVLHAVWAVILAYKCCLRRVRINVTCGKTIAGRFRYWIIPVVRLIRRCDNVYTDERENS